ncbi:molybdopterin molybdotransferase MoeA [Colwellia sp. MEBiC06753]
MTHCFSQPGLLKFEQAKNIILDNISSLVANETIAIEQACGRTLAEAVISPVNVPPHDNSAMDGYAFNSQGLIANSELTLVGKAFAGNPYQGIVDKGQCVRIMTGAKLPLGCDSVEMQENTEVSLEQVRLLQPVRGGQHVRRCGEDIRQGQVLIEAGTVLTPANIGTLASIGIPDVNVVRKLTVALIATGDELKQPGQALADGEIYESNRYFLSAMLKKLSFEVIDLGVIPDDKTQISQAFKVANQQADVVISSGGVSVGEADYTKTVLEELGEIGFWKIAMKPGKPFAFGQLADSQFFGLPGNPVSAFVTFYQLVVPALCKMQGRELPNRISLQAKTQTPLKKASGRQDFQRGIWQLSSSGELVVTSTGSQGSGILSSITKANCFIILAQEQGNVAKGELVTIELFDKLIIE